MIDRINQIIQNKGLSLSGFAEEIGVQRSSISHILSGRNKPSLDFVMKILERYPEISTDWLLSGKGSAASASNLFEHDNTENTGRDQKEEIKDIIKEEPKPTKDSPLKIRNKDNIKREIKKIILFYNDDTFDEVIPK